MPDQSKGPETPSDVSLLGNTHGMHMGQLCQFAASLNVYRSITTMRRGEDKDAQHLLRLASLMQRRTRRVEQLKVELFEELNKPIAPAQTKRHQHGSAGHAPTQGVTTQAQPVPQQPQPEASPSHEHSICKAEPGADAKGCTPSAGAPSAAAEAAAARKAAKQKLREHQREQRVLEARVAKRARIAERASSLQEAKASLLQEQARLLQMQTAQKEQMKELEAKLTALSEEKHRLFLMMKEVLSSQALATPTASMHAANGFAPTPMPTPASTLPAHVPAPLLQPSEAGQPVPRPQHTNVAGDIQHPASTQPQQCQAQQDAPILLAPPSSTAPTALGHKPDAGPSVPVPGAGQEQSGVTQEAGGSGLATGLQGKGQAGSTAAATTSRHDAVSAVQPQSSGRTRPAFGQRSRGSSGGGAPPTTGPGLQHPKPQDVQSQQAQVPGPGSAQQVPKGNHSRSDEEGELVEEGEVRGAGSSGAALPSPTGSRPGSGFGPARSQSFSGVQPVAHGREGDNDSTDRERARDKDRFGSGGGHRHAAWQPPYGQQGEGPGRPEHGGGRGDGFPGPRSSSGGGYGGPPQRSYSFGGGPVGYGRGGRGGRFGGSWGGGSQGNAGPGRHSSWHER